MAWGAPIAPVRMGLLAFASAAGIAVSALAASAWAATGPYPVSNTPSEYIPVATLFRGATVYGTGKPVVVRFVHSTADWGNQLFFMDPRSGAEKALMNYIGSGRGKLCPDSGGLRAELGVFDSTQEVVFMLRTISSNYAGQYCTGEACGPRYTGLNDPVKSRFHSRGEFSHMAGHIWSEAARINSVQADSLAPPCAGAPSVPGEEGILFSFNDGANGTFGDLVILVTGVEMDIERAGLPKTPIDPPPEDLFPVKCAIDAKAGGVTRGESFLPQAMDLPVSAIVPRHHPMQPRLFLDQYWRGLDAGRPDETHFPNGPDIKISTPGPFEFNLGFFTNQGEFVNRARGEVTAEMLRNLEVEVDGRRTLSLMWYPASLNGNRVSTGAYVVRGTLRTLPKAKPIEPGHLAASCPEARYNLLSTFGFIRR